MTWEALTKLLSGIEMMGGDALSEVLAPSEIRAIAETLAQAGLVTANPPVQTPTISGLEFLTQDAFVLGGSIIPRSGAGQPHL